jgi:cytochrome c556
VRQQFCLAAIISTLLMAGAASAETTMQPMIHQHSMPATSEQAMQQPMAPMSAEDSRPLVKMTPETIALLRADMRLMLSAYTTIFNQLAEGKYSDAAKAIEENLGMTAMKTHPGMMKASQELPDNMRMLGMNMHKSASELAISLKKKNQKPAAVFSGMQQIFAGCSTCHMAYRVR